MNKDVLRNLRIAIVGGGYGGIAAAVALEHVGAKNVAVYERAAAFGQVGAGIGLRPETVERFRTWGIVEAIDAVSSPSDHLEIWTGDGESLIIEEEWPHRRDFDRINDTRMIHRGDFIEAFASQLPAGALHLGHRLVEIVENDDAVTLSFSNGVFVDADVVIGADGIHSVVRQTFFSDRAPVFAREHAYRIVLDIADAHGLVTDDNPRFYMGENGTIAYNLPLRHRGQISYDITARSDDESWAPEITNDGLVAMLEGFDARIVAVARELDVTQMTARAVYDIEPVDRWHTDRVAIMGDAAHAMLHHQGQGANSAIADAEGLADAFVQATTVADALELFQATRKPVTDELQRVSRAGWTPDAVEDAFPGQR